jgi:hypothetical protein
MVLRSPYNKESAMARMKGSQNKQIKQPSVFTMTTQQRIELLANIIVDRIIADTTPQPKVGEGNSNV